MQTFYDKEKLLFDEYNTSLRPAVHPHLSHNGTFTFTRTVLCVCVCECDTCAPFEAIHTHGAFLVGYSL